MNPILPTEETIDYEDRLYLNPQIGLDESNQFIENLRETQDNNIAQIQTQTQRLGTDVPSSLGGLTGPGSYFTSRYATPQNLSTLQNLRTAAQATALNQVLANEQAMWKKRYEDAYRAYQKREYDSSKQQNNPGTADTPNGGVDKKDNSDDTYTAKDAGGTLTDKNLAPGASRLVYSVNGYIYTEDTLADGRKVISNTDDPNYVRADDGYFYKVKTHDSFGPFTWGLSDEDRKNRANNAAQLEKIRYYAAKSKEKNGGR